MGFRIYTIPKGEHSSGTFYNHPDNSRIVFKFMLDESAIYQTEVPENQHDVNKIYGFSDFGKIHQKYSIRLGWRYIDGNVELCWLRHENGKHSSAKIRNIEINEIYSAVINISEGDLIIFPAYLPHSVEENQSDEDRVVVSFNLDILR